MTAAARLPEVRIKAFSPKAIDVATRAAAAHFRVREGAELPPPARRAAVFGLSIFFRTGGPEAAVLAGVAADTEAGAALLAPGYISGEAAGKAALSVADALNWAFVWKRESETQRPPVAETPVPNAPRKTRAEGWSDAELETLRAGRAAGKKVAALMADLPGRTEGAIHTKIRDLKLPPAKVERDTPGAWSEAENAIVARGRARGEKYTVIAARLPGRKPASCRVQAQKLGITKRRTPGSEAVAVAPVTERSIHHPAKGALRDGSEAASSGQGAGGPWSDGERDALKAARLSGERWTETLKRFPGRTMNGVRAEFGRLTADDPDLLERAREASARMRAGGRGPRWTPDEDAIVRAGVEAGRSDADIAADLKRRTPEAVRSRAKVLRIHTRPTEAEKLAGAQAAVIWTPADDAVIAEIAAKGYSADTAIARLPRHDRDMVRAKLAMAERRARREAHPRGEAISSGPAIEGAENRGVNAALSLAPKQCRWPVGDPREPDFHFCGAAKVRGQYCAAHAAMAYPPKQKRRRARQDAAAALDSLQALREARIRRAVQ